MLKVSEYLIEAIISTVKHGEDYIPWRKRLEASVIRLSIHRIAEKGCSRKRSFRYKGFAAAYRPRAASKASFASTVVSRFGPLAPHTRHSVS